jgi:hypothetical protein
VACPTNLSQKKAEAKSAETPKEGRTERMEGKREKGKDDVEGRERRKEPQK